LPASNGYCFNVVGLDNDREIYSTFQNLGYRALVSTGGTYHQIPGLDPFSVNSITVTMSTHTIGDTAFVSFRVANTGTSLTYVDLRVAGDLAVGADTFASAAGRSSRFQAYSGGVGFLWESPELYMSLAEVYPGIGTPEQYYVPSSMSYMVLIGRDSAFSASAYDPMQPGVFTHFNLSVRAQFVGDPPRIEVREFELPGRMFQTGELPLAFRIFATPGSYVTVGYDIVGAEYMTYDYFGWFFVENEVQDYFESVYPWIPDYGNWSFQFWVMDEAAQLAGQDEKKYYTYYLPEGVVIPTPALAVPSPRASEEQFTEYARRRFRIREIFQYAYMIPLVVY
jgi:hypothetical protein